MLQQSNGRENMNVVFCADSNILRFFFNLGVKVRSKVVYIPHFTGDSLTFTLISCPTGGQCAEVTVKSSNMY